MNAFMQLVLFFTTLFTLLARTAAMPIHPPAAADLESPTVQRATSPFLPSGPEHVVKHFVTPVYPTATSSSTATLDPVEGQPTNEKTTINDADKPGVESHSVALIVFFALIPFAACVVLYPVCKRLARVRADPNLTTKSLSGEKPKQPGSPVSSYINNPRLAPLPTYPQMVYVPPAAKDGTHSIFGHFRSPSGDHVYGDTDRWVMTEEGALYGVRPTTDPQKLFVRPV